MLATVTVRNLFRGRFTGLLLFMFMVILAPATDAQEVGQIVGQVTEETTGVALPGAQVYITGVGVGTLSSGTGRFLLTNVPAGEHIVQVELLGYGSAERQVTVQTGEATAVNFELGEQVLALEEIVVTGTAFAQQRRAIGNNVGRFDAARRQEIAPVPTTEMLLQGSEPGLMMDYGSQGGVGNSATIRIRGASSIVLRSEPLIYIDGVRVNSESDGPSSFTNNYRAFPTRLQEINPEEIESVEVIKGPAAATLYGTEASNGVINFITKKGSVGQPRYSLRLGGGATWLPDPISQYPAAYYRCRGITNNNCVEHGITYQPGEVVEFRVLQREKEVHGNEFGSTGLPRSVGGSVEGGSGRLRYYGSMDWNRDEGYQSSDWRNRWNGRANINLTPSDALDIQFGIGAMQYDQRSGNHNSQLGTFWACIAPGCEEGAGGFAVDGPFRGFLQNMFPVFLDSVFETRDVHRSTYTAQVNHRPLPWFSQRVNAGLDLTHTSNRHLTLPHAAGSNSAQGEKRDRTNRTEMRYVDYSATVTLDASPALNFATSGGLQYNEREFREIDARGREFPASGITTVEGARRRTIGDRFIENKTIGAYVQEQLSWQNRFFLTGAVRADDNSAFGKDFDFVTYPKLSSSWVVSEESFMAGTSSWLNQLRLRGAWGKAGQQPDVFAAVQTFAALPEGGLTPQNIGNPELKPETGSEVEMGFDASLWSNRLGLEFTYFTQRRSDALVSVPVPPTSGFPGSQFRNLGEIENSGIELGLSAPNLYSSRNVNVDLSVAFSTNNNEIVAMGGVAPIRLRGALNITGYNPQWYLEGFPLGAIFLKKVVSANIDGSGADANAVNVMCESGEIVGEISPGQPVSRGGGPPVPCDVAPQLYQGQPVPTRVASITPTVTLFNRLSLFAQVDYMGGHNLIDGVMAGKHGRFRNSRAVIERTDPIFLGYTSLGSEGLNQTGLFDAGFARLRRVSATYTFPESWTAMIGADRMSLTVSGTNLWLIWQAASSEDVYDDWIIDPETRTNVRTGTDPGGLDAWIHTQEPPMKRFMAMIRVNF